MTDKPTPEDFGSSEALLRFIQERSDDIEKAIIFPPGFVLTEDGRQRSHPNPDFSMMLIFLGGERKLTTAHDAEMVLNDGILNRMKIRIELNTPNGVDRTQGIAW